MKIGEERKGETKQEEEKENRKKGTDTANTQRQIEEKTKDDREVDGAKQPKEGKNQETHETIQKKKHLQGKRKRKKGRKKMIA